MTNFLDIFERELRNQAETNLIEAVKLDPDSIGARQFRMRYHLLLDLAAVVVQTGEKADEQS